MLIYQESFECPLILGSGRYPSPQDVIDSIERSGAQIVTLSLRCESVTKTAGPNQFFELIKNSGVKLLPNTAGSMTTDEAVTLAHMSREVFDTAWIKLEVITDPQTLAPDVFKTFEAAKELVQEGFKVLPYMTADISLCEKLVDLGCEVLMPWAAPIGSGKGITDPESLIHVRKRFPKITLIVDAGLGKPSHAALAMELGCDGVMVNTAIAQATKPAQMAHAFAIAAKAGRLAYQSGLMTEQSFATPSTSLEQSPFWNG